MFEYDKSSKWLIQHHGGAILRIAGLEEIASWRALAAEVVQPRKLPDGLIEVRREGRDEPDLFVLELMTYPDAGLAEQALRDLAIVDLDRREVPEVLALILHPKGSLRTDPGAERTSRIGWAGLAAHWRVVELWTIPAERLLATEDVGVVPWVPLSRIDGDPAPILRRCRERIDREAAPDEIENMLAVSQVFAGLRYNHSTLIQILGGRTAMIESPILQELKAEWTREASHEASRQAKHQAVAMILDARFGPEASQLSDRLDTIVDEGHLDALLRAAATCPDLAAFSTLLTTAP